MPTYMKITRYTGSGSKGPTGILQTIARFGLLIVGAIVGIFALVLTASAALVVVLSLIFLAAIVFAWFWIRAKVFGKPIGGKAFADMQAAAKAQQDAMRGFAGLAEEDHGDIIDAVKTPEGWSVNE